MNDKSDPNDELSLALRALAHPARLAILKFLSERRNECCCSDVTGCLPLAQSTVSQHLKVLLDSGLIARHARGTRNCYSLRNDRLDAVQVALNGVLGSLSAASGEEARR